MKWTLMIFLSCCSIFEQIQAQDLYSLSFTGLDNSTINLSAGRGKRIIVVAFDAANPNRTQLKGLDSIYRYSGGSITVIGIPVNDFSAAPAAVSILGLLRDSMQISYPLAVVSQGKSGSGQHPLMQWLTTTSPKNRFKLNFSVPGQVFIVAPNGLLYAFLGPQLAIGGPDMQHILSNWPTE